MTNLKRVLLLCVPLALGAVLWGVNWKLDHPPQTKVDKEFEFQIAGADEMAVFTFSASGKSRVAKFQGQELQRFVGLIKLPTYEPTPLRNVYGKWKVLFFRKGKILNEFDLNRDANLLCNFKSRNSTIVAGKTWAARLDARSARRMKSLLDALHLL